MVKTHPLGFRVDPEIKEGLEKAARADRRSVSNLIEGILRGWLEERGFMQPPQPVDIQVKFVTAGSGETTDGPRVRVPSKSDK